MVSLQECVFGQDSMIHRDDSDGTDIFAIIFFNDDMNAYDAGELQTYIGLTPYKHNKDFHKSETNYSINPKAGRIVIADARILHRGLPPSRFYSKIRFTVVMKMKVKNKIEAFNKLGFVW